MNLGAKYPQAQEFIQNNFYVDDGLVSTDSEEEATKIAQMSIEVNQCQMRSTNVMLE